MMLTVRTSAARKALAAGAALALLTLTLAPRGVAAQHAKAPIQLIFWQWATGTKEAADLWNKSHPGIQVKVINPGAGTPLYNKLTTAIKAGTGAPDVAHIEYQFLPQFIATGGIQDISKYGASSAKDLFAPWTWAQVSQGSSVYAIPWDTGPTALYYRSDIFKKYGIAIPKTWADYEAAGIKLHKANPSIYIHEFDPTDGGWFTSFVWQAGGRPFTRNGDNWKVAINDAASVKVAEYWGRLIKEGVVKVETDFNPSLYSDWNKGIVVTRISAIWDQNTFHNNAASTVGKWQVTDLPQWTAGSKFVVGNWGGSTMAVTKQSKHPQEAAQFAIWMNTTPQPYDLMIKGNGLWPASTKVLHAGLQSLTGKNPYYAGQDLFPVFTKATTAVDTSFQWGPATSFTYSTLSTNLTAATKGTMSFKAALDKTQKQVVAFMNQQGFSASQ